jgi:hypothetical protein
LLGVSPWYWAVVDSAGQPSSICPLHQEQACLGLGSLRPVWTPRTVSWDHAKQYISKAKERFEAAKELLALCVKDNDYFAYQERFKELRSTLQRLGEPWTETCYHDKFISGHGNFWKDFMASRMDHFHSTGSGDDQRAHLTVRSLTYLRPGLCAGDVAFSPAKSASMSKPWRQNPGQ